MALKGTARVLFEKLSVRSSADKNYFCLPTSVIEAVNKQKVTTNVALAMIRPIAYQFMIPPLCR